MRSRQNDQHHTVFITQVDCASEKTTALVSLPTGILRC